MNNTKKISALVIGVAVAIGGVLWLGTGTKTIKVPCIIPKFDTTFETQNFCDTTVVYYDSIYKVKGKFYRGRQYWKNETKRTDSVRIDNCRDSSVMKVDDNSYEGLCDAIVKDTIVNIDTMLFGLWIQGGDIKTPQKIEFIKSLGAKVGRVDLVLSQYNGGVLPELKEMNDAGLRSDLILSWNNKMNGKFVRDTAEFRRKLTMFLQANKQYDFFVTTEDEVITENFFIDTMQYYVNELIITVNECHKYGIEASNSGDHIVYAGILAVDENTRKGNEGKMQILLEAYKKIPMDFLTLHNGMEQTPAEFNTALEYIKKVSGFDRFAMNAHVFKGEDVTVIKPMVQLYKDNGFILFMPFDGNGTAKASQFHVQKSITKTEWGMTFHNVIKLN